MFGLGKAAEGIQARVFDLYLFFYYVQVLGLSGTLAGVAVAIALVCDGITDPLTGSISDRHRSRLGRRHPFMYASVVPVGVTFYLLFVPPEGLGQWGLFLWFTVFAVLVRSSLTLFHVPYLSLGAELSSDYEERTEIAMARSLCAAIGSVAALLLGMFYFLRSKPGFENGQLDISGYPPYALTCAIAMAALIFISTHWTRSEIPRLPQPTEAPDKFTFTQIYRDLAAALANDSFRALFLGLILLAVTLGINTTLTMHMATYYWGLTSEQIGFYVLSGGVGFVVSLAFVKSLQRWLDKREAFLVALTGVCVFSALPPTLRELGFFPDNESPWLLPSVQLLFGLGAFFVSIAGVVGASMMADVADQHEYETGLRQQAVFFGAASFSGKLSGALGQLLAGVALDWIVHFPRGVAPGEVPADTLSRLGLFAGPGAAIGALLALRIFARYELSRDRHKVIQEALSRRLTTETSRGEGAQVRPTQR